MNLAFSQRPIYERLLKYLSRKTLGRLIRTSKNMYKIGQLTENRAILYNWSYHRAIVKNDLDMIQYLHKKRWKYDESDMQLAIIKGNLDIFKFLYSNNENTGINQEDINAYLHCAAIPKNGNIQIMKWLCENIQYKTEDIEKTIELIRLVKTDRRNPQIEKWLSKYLRMRKLSQAFIM